MQCDLVGALVLRWMGPRWLDLIRCALKNVELKKGHAIDLVLLRIPRREQLDSHLDLLSAGT
ncbi:unannotated protein [freshwater metagenome]|uniref:Unannotated protein n=1 Tax=freshwater metagenome TaxID=449393 RepID=A0A6J7IHJ4_9ZZZZ